VGHLATRLNTLAAMITGIVGGKSANLSSITCKVPGGARRDGTKPESRVKRFERWLRNKAVDSETLFLPFAKALLLSLSHVPLVLVIDGSIVGRGLHDTDDQRGLQTMSTGSRLDCSHEEKGPLS
jgi:hypothetical protein